MESISSGVFGGNGSIQVTGLEPGTDISELLERNDTLPIFQDVQIILNDEDKDNKTVAAVFEVNGTKVEVDLADPNVVFSPHGLTIGSKGQQVDIPDELREKVTIQWPSSSSITS